MTEESIENIVNVLKGIVDQNSPKCLADEPYRVYAELIESEATDRKTAAALLYLFASGMLETVDSDYDAELLSSSIRRECSLNKRMSDKLAIILHMLYSHNNRKEWQKKEREGLLQFLKEEFSYDWEGFAVWDAGNGTVDCHYEARIILMPTVNASKDKDLVKLLEKNPFTTKETIHDLFAERLQKYLDYKFEDYCTEDDYYQPVVEDYGSNLDYDLEKWGKENGFEFVSCEGNGRDDGYEPKYRKGWY